jgi:hypothetical protein
MFNLNNSLTSLLLHNTTTNKSVKSSNPQFILFSRNSRAWLTDCIHGFDGLLLAETRLSILRQLPNAGVVRVLKEAFNFSVNTAYHDIGKVWRD